MKAEVPPKPTGTSQSTVWLSGEVITLLNKLVLPGVWLVFLVGIVLWTLLKLGRISIASDFRFFVAVVLLGTAFMLWMSARLERVGYVGRELIVSNYRREIRIPFDHIEAVEPVWWYRRRMVRIRFRYDTAFGQVVYYMPKWGFLRCFGRAPEKELRDLIA